MTRRTVPATVELVLAIATTQPVSQKGLAGIAGKTGVSSCSQAG